MPDFGIFRGFNEKLFGDKLYAGQLPTQLGIIGSQEVFDIDLDAQAFFDRVTAAVGTLSVSEKNAVEALVVKMKLDGIWTKMKAIYPMVEASAAACAQNLKSSSFTLSFSTGWTFATTGATPNGTSAWADTFLNVNTLATDSISLGYYSRTNTQTQQGHYIDASTNITSRFAIANFSGAYYVFMSNSTNFPLSTQINSLGFFQGYRNNTSNVQGYKNLTKIFNNVSNPISSLINKTFEIGRNSFSTTGYTNEECAFAYIGDGLTDAQAEDYYTAVNSFEVTLNRNV